jgi:hypothetical protein
MAAIRVHEFISLDAVIDTPSWTLEYGSDPKMADAVASCLPDVVELFELLPNAQLAVLPGTTHVGVTRRPREVLTLITPFLDPC